MKLLVYEEDLLKRYKKALIYCLPKMTFEYIEINGIRVDTGIKDIYERWERINDEINLLYKKYGEAIEGTITNIINEA